MLLIYTFLLLPFVYYFFTGGWLNFTRISCSNSNDTDFQNSTEDDTDNITIEELPEVSNHLNDTCCPISFKTIINPYKDQGNVRHGVLPACVKCAICLAVAENIEKVFESTFSHHKKCTPGNEQVCLNDDLNHLCNNGFINYDLRAVNGLSLITDIYRNTNHVRTEMDGLWTQMYPLIHLNRLRVYRNIFRLRKSCGNLLERLNTIDVFAAYKSSSLNITDYLCRGFGIFRDCNNIKFEVTQIPEEGYTSVKFWVNCLLN